MPRGALFCITLLAIAAGCEVAPGPHRAPPATADTANGSAAAAAGSNAPENPTPAPPGNPTPAPPANPPAANDGAGSAGTAAAAVPPPSGEPKASCVKAANHIAELQSASLTDPSQKQTFDQQRDQVVAQVAAGCTAESWSDAVVACITNASAISALTPCSDMLRKEREAKAPAPPAAPPPRAAAPTPPPPPTAAQH